MNDKTNQAKEVVTAVTDYLNSYFNKDETFVEQMNKEHRTLQQSFTRLCLCWLENCASESYNFDKRNEASHELSKELIENFLTKRETMSNPSQYLPLI